MADAATRAAGKKPGDDVVRLAVKRFQSAWAADKANREAAYDDMEFATGKSQWPAEIRREREGESRPCLTVNHIPKFRQFRSGSGIHIQVVFQHILKHRPCANLV